MIIQNNYKEQITNVVVLRVGEIYVDIDKKMYMLMYVKKNKKLCRFFSLSKQQLYSEMCYEGLQIKQVT